MLIDVSTSHVPTRGLFLTDHAVANILRSMVIYPSLIVNHIALFYFIGCITKCGTRVGNECIAEGVARAVGDGTVGKRGDGGVMECCGR
jgi:hypothetical protein